MIPGLATSAEARLRELLNPRITALGADDLAELPYTMLSAGDPELAALGVHLSGDADVTVVVTDRTRPIGRLEVQVAASGCLLFLDNRAAGGHLHGNIRMLGTETVALFPGLGDGYVALHTVFMRSHRQMLFWGAGATAVGCSIEMEGEDRVVAIGDDALISSDVWIRNHDMHAIVDLRSGHRVDRAPVDVIVERHVWIGQNAMLLNCQRVGAGAIVGAQSLVKNTVAGCVAVGGVPARLLRSEVSWGRDAVGMTEAERQLVARLHAIDGFIAVT